MNWQLLQFCLAAVFLLCAAMAFYLKRNVGWVGAIRVSMLIFGLLTLFIATLTFLSAVLDSYPLLYQSTLLLTLSISILLIIYTTWELVRFLLIIRKAGRLGQGIAHTSFILNWVFLIFLPMSLPSIYDGRIDLHNISYIFWACLFLNIGIRSIQYRQNGVIYKGQFIAWQSVDSLTWKTVYSKEMLNLHLKSSSEIMTLNLARGERNDIVNFIKLKLPHQFAQANSPNVPSEITTPPNSLPIT